MPLPPIDKRIESRLTDLVYDNITMRDNQQSIRERLVALEAEVRELQAHIRRQDRRDGSDRAH